jgi:thiamine transporter ThiT
MITIETAWNESLLVEDFTAAFYSAAVNAQLMVASLVVVLIVVGMLLDRSQRFAH